MTQYDKVIPPGSEGKLIASIDISHLKGQISKQVDFSTNDPSMPQSRVMIQAVVKTFVTVEPEFVRFQSKKGQTSSQEIKLSTEGGARLTGATSTSSAFSVKLDPAGKPNLYHLKVNLNSNVPIGTTRGEVKVAVQGPIQEVTVPVVAIIQGPLSIDPPNVAFVVRDYPEEVQTTGAVDMKQAPDMTATTVQKVDMGRNFRVIRQEGEWYQVIVAVNETEVKNASGKTTKVPEQKIGWLKKNTVKISKDAAGPDPIHVSIQNSTGQEFKVLNFQASDPDIKVDLKPSLDAKSVELTVTMARVPKKKGSQRSFILLTTDNTDQPEVKIPVFVTVT